MKAVVEVIMSGGRLRVKPINLEGFVRFPNHLRILGATYEVELKEGRAGSWIAVGPITQLPKSIHFIKSLKNKAA